MSMLPGKPRTLALSPRARVWLRGTLLLLLLSLAQLGALTHALGHLQHNENSEHGRAADTLCTWCAAYAQGSHAVSSAAVHLPDFAGATCLPLFFAITAPRPQACHGYQSQAPPLS